MGLGKLSVGVVVLGILYSTAYCDTSNIFNIVKPNRSSSSASSSSSSSSHPQHQQQKPHRHQKKVNVQQDYPSTKHQGGSNSESVVKALNVSQMTITVPKIPLVLRNLTGNGTATGRQYMITGATGWGWPGHSAGNLDLYSLLGGLAFLGLLASLFLFFSNRTTSPTIVINGRRRRDVGGLGGEEDLLGETFTDILGRLGLSLDSPWWGADSVDKKNVTPFKLV